MMEPRRRARCRSWLLAAVAGLVLLGGCGASRPAATGAAFCTADGAPTPDVAGRADGVYGVVDGRAGPQPLARFDRIVRTGEGVDPQSGKPWLRFRLGEDEARAIEEFTRVPAGRAIAVVVGGQVASLHKVKVPIRTRDLQLSCCNPRACDRWKALTHE